MAIYHFEGTVISRSKGKSAIASAAYRSGEKLYDERQEKTFDYGRKQDIGYKEILLPDGAPEWMADREKLWNAVERAENRKDSQLAREVHFSLPREFTKEQNIELAREFVKNEFVSHGMVADLCIHDGKTKAGEEQPHAHVMLTMREVTEDGFGLKNRSWNAKENYMLWREAWAEHANKYLALNGIDQRLDHRSYAEQGIDLVPQNKIGPKNLLDHEQRIKEHRLIAKENGDKILEDPGIALKAITHHQSTFTHQDLARFVNRYTVDAEQFQLVYEKVKASEQIVSLMDEQGRERFTTKDMLVLESKMLDDAISLKDRSFIAVKGAEDKEIGTTLASTLTSQQQDALKHITEDGDIKCLVGYAGTGKSHLLGQAKDLWENEGYRVHGVTLSGIAAENLEGASGIQSRTLASRCYYWDKGAELLTQKDVLIIDEAGMLGSRQVARVLEEVKAGGAKAVFIGDPQQLQAIEAGAAFRAISEQTGYLELTEIRRQQEPWQQEATKEFALRHTQEAIDLYEQHGFVHFFEKQEDAKLALVEKWNEVRLSDPDKSQIMLAYTNRDSQELNEVARDYRKDNQELGEEHGLQTVNGNKEFAINDRIYFLRNDRNLGVKNGSLGTIESIEAGRLTVRLDETRVSLASDERREVVFDISQYNHITYGYAATIHKAQGVTVDKSYILASKHLDNHAAYVGMSRHRESADLYWSKEEFSNKKELEQTLGRDRSKDVTLDYINNHDGTRENSDQAISAEFTQERPERVKGLINELHLLGKEEQKPDNRVEEYFKEIRELGQTGPSNEAQKYLDELKENVKEQEQEIAAYKDLEDFKSFQERFEREHSELALKAQEELEAFKTLHNDRERIMGKEASGYETFINDYANSKALDKETIALETFQMEFERNHPREAELAREEIAPPMSAQERRAEKLVDRYYDYEERYHDLEERGGSRFSLSEAKDQMERCSHEICNDPHAMDYLQKNDLELFQQMEQEKELERMMERDREMDFSL